jgi:beta-galactosidase
MRNLILTFILITILVFSLDAQIPEVKITMVNGNPELFINSGKIPPVMTFVNTGVLKSYEISERQIRYAAQYGDIHLHQINFGLPITAEGKFDFESMKSSLDLVRKGDPKGFAIIRLHVGGNYKSHGGYTDDDRVKFSDGTVSDVISIASDKMIENAARMIRAAVEFSLQNPEYGKIIAGYFPSAGNTGEWFQFEYREHGVDVSGVNTNKFRRWLVKKYNNNKSLQTSWRMKDVNFDNAQIPSDELGSEKVNGNERKLFDRPFDQRIMDYLDYYNEMTADRLIYLAKVIKEATNGKSLAGFFYGYIFDLWESKSGHYNLEKVLRCPEIDFLASPISYRSRNEGEIGGSMSLTESVQGHGKLWFDECDYRSPTRTAEGRSFGADFMPYVKTLDGLREIFRRQIGFQMIRGNGCWPMDLMGLGWYDDTDFWKQIKLLDELYLKYEKIRPPSSPEVALVMDEEGLALAADNNFNIWMLEWLRDELYTAGVNFGIYMREDIEKGFAPDAKLYIIAGAFRLQQESVNNLAKVLHQKGKTTAWVYSFGITPEAEVKKLLSESLNGSKQIFYQSNVMKADTIRSLAKSAGANVFVSGGYDACMANDNLLVLHTLSEGERTIHFPEKTDVYEQFSNKWYLKIDTLQVRVPLAKTFIFFYGEKTSLQKAGIGL